jgi:superfamily II DNA or RNA helicase
MEINGTRARAQVEGAEQVYGVGLDWAQVGADRVLHAFCDCQRFAGGKPCKHLWATLLALGESGIENQPPGKDRLALRKDRAASWKDLDLPINVGGGRRSVVAPGQARAVHARSDGPPPDADRSNRAARNTQRVASDRSRTGGRRQTNRTGRGATTSWRSQLISVREEVDRLSKPSTEAVSTKSPLELRFLVNTTESLGAGHLVLDIFGTKLGAKGPAGKLKRASIDPEELESLLLPVNSASGFEGGNAVPSLAVVAAFPADPPGRHGRRGPRKNLRAPVQHVRLPRELYGPVLSHLCTEGTLGWWDGRSLRNPQALSLDEGSSWQFVLHMEAMAEGRARISGYLEREGQSIPLSVPVLILPGSTHAPSTTSLNEIGRGEIGRGETGLDETGPDETGPDLPAEASSAETSRRESSQGVGNEALVFFPESIARLEVVPERDFPWIKLLRGSGEVIFPKEDLEAGLTSLLKLPSLPRLEAPEELQLIEELAPPRPRLVLEPDTAPDWMNPPLLAELSYMYGGLMVNAGDPRQSIVDWQERKYVRRDMEREHLSLVRLLELGLRPVASEEGHGLELSPQDLPAVAEPLLLEGWEMEVHGTSLRPPSPPALRVESGIDWFELSGNVDFAGDPVELAAVLEAVSRGDRFVDLGDGSKGLLPAAWLETYGSLAKLATESSETGLRFLPSQALLVDALLAAMPPADVDSAFAELRGKLRSFESVKPKKEPRSFGGTLRGYQRQGLGWLGFLREFGLGGVLADDMGLGKTVQVLALLQVNRTPSKTTKIPFLVVAPRSLVYNWIDEASHFTPKMKVVEYGGTDREALREKFNKFDLIVTTYGTLRRDIGFLAKVEFDTVILDEAQAIKNPTSQTARASVLLNARHRLALTGTPIENHLGELGSLFEFLNPGLLGRLPKLEVLSGGRAASRHELALVTEGMRPFILRRTKAQVLPDLPPKTEQVLICTLHPRQRELYDQLRASYQTSLLEQVESKGVSGSAIQVLEALLRLRQIACHPGLVNAEWEEAGSAKLDALFAQVAEVLDEGHKVLVFSQFTKLLAFVKTHLEEEGVNYAYLDGQTKNRGELVEKFQTDETCNLFLISLKAGGVGLNITAADYVFLLDPWWNPAVEAQAIDRAHRIGQTKPVFAYRMIARDTVEEKILELQQSKRQIADAILEGGGGQSLRDLTSDDLRMLLS